MFRLPCRVTGLEFQPFAGLGVVTLMEGLVRLERISRLSRILRMAGAVAEELFSGKGLWSLRWHPPYVRGADVVLRKPFCTLERLYARMQRRVARPAVPFSEYHEWSRLRERGQEKRFAARGSGAPAPVCVVVDVCEPHSREDLDATLSSVQETRRPFARVVLLGQDIAPPGVEIFTGCHGNAAWERLDSILGGVRGEHIWLLRPGERVHSLSADFLARALDNEQGNAADLVCVFGDEDSIALDGRRSAPLLKPGWDPVLGARYNLLGPAALYSAAWLRQTKGTAGEWDALRLEFAQAVSSLPESRILHLPHVLMHIPEGHRIAGRDPVCSTCSLDLPEPLPSVSVIIPTRDGVRHLRPCVESMRSLTDYSEFEILVLDNGSRTPETLDYLAEQAGNGSIRVERADFPFNYSRLNNLGASLARGDILVFCNDDLEVLDKGWLRELVSWAALPEVGAVGALLTYANGLVQHAGVVPGMMFRTAGHVYRHMCPEDVSLPWVLQCPRSVAANTAACLAVKRSLHEAVGGFDQDMAVAYNDVDYCLKLRGLGKCNVFTPRARLIHHESLSRGRDDNPEKKARHRMEKELLQQRWKQVLVHPPHYHPALSLETEQGALCAEE